MADMVVTIRGKQPWTGIIKNRRKNGDYYWLRLNISPVFVKGKYVGSLMVHSKPTREEIAHIALPNALFNGVVAPKSHEGARVMNLLADAWEVGTGDIFPGILLQYSKVGLDEPLEVSYIGLTVHKGDTSMLVVDTATLDDAKPSRMVVKIDAACARCIPLVDDQGEEVEEFNELDDGEFDLE
jgi:hypothetical protein